MNMFLYRLYAEPAKPAGPRKNNILQFERDKASADEFNQFRELIRNAGGFLDTKISTQ